MHLKRIGDKMKQGNRKILSSLLCTVLISSVIYAKDEGAAPAEIGWRFGNFDETKKEEKEKPTPKSLKEILKKMLEVQEEQLEVQKDIRKILKDRYDPEPETIIVNGKPCIANSSAECYKWLPEPEAKRYPIIGEFFANPTVDKAAQYLQWYSKHTNNASKAGISMYMAKYQYGENATKFDIKKEGMLDSKGKAKKAQDVRERRLFSEHTKDFYVNYYLGRGLDVDVYGLEGMSYLMQDVPNMKVNLIFFNNDVKKKITEISEHYRYIKRVLDSASASYIDANMFKENGIYSTPSFELVLNKDKSSQIMGTGKISQTGIIKKSLKYLWLKEVVKDSYMNDYKMWDDSNYIESQMWDKLGKSINVDKYQYRNTDMQPKELQELTK